MTFSKQLFIQFVFSALAILTLFQTPLHAQEGTVTFRCPSSAPNTRLFKRVIQAAVTQNVDSDSYSDIRTRVKLRLVGPGTQDEETATFATILDGLTLTQTDLVSSLDGTIAFSSTCTYPYIVRVRVTATDISSSARLSSSNDSPIEVTVPVEKRIRRFRIE
ncbi:MAG: hypothetical protein KDD64_01870 [Bdellovibrionales bacterium]|nr:hypothetical protein [Bdellovibrionales bacterium]